MDISKILRGITGQNLLEIIEIFRASAYTFTCTTASRGASYGLVTGHPIVIHPAKAILCEFWTPYVHESGYANSPSSA